MKRTIVILALMLLATFAVAKDKDTGELNKRMNPATGRILVTPAKPVMVHGDHVSGWRVTPYISVKPDGSDPVLGIQVETTSELGSSYFIVDGQEVATPLSGTSSSWFTRGNHIEVGGEGTEKLMRLIASSKDTRFVVMVGHVGNEKPKHGFKLNEKQLGYFKLIMSEFDKTVSPTKTMP